MDSGSIRPLTVRDRANTLAERGLVMQRRMRGFDIKQVCLNGHVITNVASAYPERTKKFCEECGAATITACPKCEVEMHGYDVAANLLSKPAPSYCRNCGSAFPWRQALIDAAVELANESESRDEAGLETFKQSLSELGKDSPRTELAIVRAKHFISKAGSTVGPALAKMVLELGTDAVKKHFKL